MSSMPPRKVHIKIAAIDRLLRARRGVTLAALATELGVTERSVCRYLAQMKSELHLPVAHSPERHYHYVDPSPLFVFHQAGQPAPLRPHPPAERAVPPSFSVIEQIHGALYSRSKIVLTGPSLEASPVLAHPYFLSRLAGELVLFGSLPHQRALLNLPLHQISAVQVLGERFDDELAEGPKVRRGEGWLPAGTACQVCLRFPSWAFWAASLRVCARQTVTGQGRSILIRFATNDVEALRRLVLALEGVVFVEEPAHLRSQLGPHLKAGGATYLPLPQDRDTPPLS